MIPLVRLVTQQQKDMIALDEYDYPALQNIFRVGYDIFTDEMNTKVTQETNIESFCNVTMTQYQEIIIIALLLTRLTKKHIVKYAQDGINYASNFKNYSACLWKKREGIRTEKVIYLPNRLKEIN